MNSNTGVVGVDMMEMGLVESHPGQGTTLVLLCKNMVSLVGHYFVEQKPYSDK